MKTTFTKVPTGWRWEIDDDDATFSGVRPTKVEAHAEALACWSGVLYAEVSGDSPAPASGWRVRAEAAEREVARLRAVIADEAAELPVWPADAYQTPAERDVSGVRARLLAAVAEAQPAEVADG